MSLYKVAEVNVSPKVFVEPRVGWKLVGKNEQGEYISRFLEYAFGIDEWMKECSEEWIEASKYPVAYRKGFHISRDLEELEAIRVLVGGVILEVQYNSVVAQGTQRIVIEDCLGKKRDRAMMLNKVDVALTMRIVGEVEVKESVVDELTALMDCIRDIGGHKDV